MNILDLLGIAGQAQGQGQMGQPQAPVQPPMPDIEVQADPRLKTKTGVLGGTFGVGRTGGNILGLLGDAFLTQAGRAPQYAPRLKQMREAEALQSYGSDPEEALRQYTRVSGGDGLKAWDSYRDNTRQDTSAADLHRARQDEYEGVTHQRGLSLLGASDEQSYPAMRDQFLRYYAKRGVEPPFDPPATYDKAKLLALRRSGITPEDQARLDDNRDNREAMMNYREMTAADRRAYQAQQIKLGQQRADQTGYTGRTRADLYKESVEERRRHNLATEATAKDRVAQGAKGKPGGAPKAVLQPDGTYRIVR